MMPSDSPGQDWGGQGGRTRRADRGDDRGGITKRRNKEEEEEWSVGGQRRTQ